MIRSLSRVAGCALVLLLAAFAASEAMAPAEVSELLRQSGKVLLQNARFDVSAGAPAAPADLALGAERLREIRYWIVHLRAPLTEAVRGELANRGAEILAYVPNRAYLVRASAQEAEALAGATFVDWVGPYRPDYKLSPEIGRIPHPDPAWPAGPGELLLTLTAFDGEDPGAIAAEASALGAAVVSVHGHPRAPRVTVRVAGGTERALAGIEGVEWIEEAEEVTLRNETTRWVAQSNSLDQTPVWDAGLLGEGQIIGHADGGIRESSCFFNDPDGDPVGPDHRKLVAYRGSMQSSSHGTHTAGTAAGQDESGGFADAGMAPAARISHTRTSLISGSEGSFYGYLEAAHLDGARVHTNSWGNDGTTSYTAWCRDIDRFSHDYEDNLVLFAVTNTSTLKTPENAKNVLAVGATQQAPAQATHCSGGRGPTSDGRRKPEIYLPGCGIVSASTSTCATVSSSGTSMACPAVAGCAALVRQYYEEGFHPSGAANPADALSPSGALVKATLLNSTMDMTGVSGYPSDREGWGRLNLDRGLHFAGDARSSVVKDVLNADGLETGEVDEYLIDVGGSGLPLWVTMVFTDPPAALGAALAPVNDLDLEVEGPDGLYMGNVFDTVTGVSETGGTADNLNNVERVIVGGSFTTGLWTVRVRGTSVARGPQGYALHVSGNVQESAGAVGVDVVSRLSALDSVRLAQNNPNPFHSSTVIRFALPARNTVVLSVFDIAGRRVQTLAEGTLEPGEYTVSWDGRDFSGEPAVAGIYFYRLEGAGIDETRKLVLMR